MTRGEFLGKAELPRPELVQLLCAQLGLERAQVYLAPEQEIPPADLRHLSEQVTRRRDGWPLQYLVGSAWFWSQRLRVGPGVLVPRPETETLVQEAIERAPVGGRVADIGTGSGAIALALGMERPDLRITAVEKSRLALRYARENLAGIADVLEGDLLAPLREPQEMIVSNPPYVALSQYAELPADVRREPRGALLGGADGLSVVRRIVRGAPGRLAGGGWLLLEVGQGQSAAVQELMAGAGFQDLFAQADLAAIPRVVGGRLR